MATYESFLKLNGTVGDLVFYTLNGKNIVRKKSGFNKNAFKKDPAYEKVRQNSSEFGHCSKVGKMIRNCISDFISEAGDPLLYQKFAKVMTAIKDHDTESPKGKRTVQIGLNTNSGKEILRDFSFGEIQNLGDDVEIVAGLWDHTLYFSGNEKFDEAFISTIKLNFENYVADKAEEKFAINESQTEILFQRHFTEEKDILYFAVFRKNAKIVRMGFI